jgi:UPF0755 protein
LLLIAAAVAAAWLVDARVHAPYRGYQGAEQFIDLPPGTGSKTIGDRLVNAGIVSDEITFRAALWLTGQGRHLKAGEYRFDHPMTPIEVLDQIARGDVYAIALTFPEGLTIPEMARVFEGHGLGPASAFVEAAKDTSAIRALDPFATDLEGYLFPDTYALSRHADAAKVVRLMTARFEHVFTPELRQSAAARGLSIRQTMTLASLVEKETARGDERPMVAAVYENRLRIGMALQCDPTVIYALQRAGTYDGNLRRDDLAFNSPYNTYRYPGLPPGPIASPGLAAIEAVLHPADEDFLYFVSRNDGSHAFARHLDEHNRNVQKFQAQYFRGRQAGRADEPGRSGRSAVSGGSGRAGKTGGPGL